MPGKIYTVRNSFNSGEISELCNFREDIAKYNSACRKLQNLVPLVEGGAKKMPGTYFAGATALGGSIFTGSIAGSTLTVTASAQGQIQVGQTLVGAGISPGTIITALGTGTGGIGTYIVSIAQLVLSGLMQTVSSGKSRLVPFQFSTTQGAILEFSAGLIRIWEGASEGSWSLGLALGTPPASANYNPTTAYTDDVEVLVGPYAAAQIIGGASGSLYIAAPYGTSYTTTGPIYWSINTADTLSVSVIGVAPNQRIAISLANATPAKNAAPLIQAAIQALGSLNVSGNNYVDLTAWTVTPDPVYYASPWITFGTGLAESWNPNSSIAVCTQANQNDQFPFTGLDQLWNSSYWAPSDNADATPIELTTPYTEEDLFALDCSTQSADILWIFHPNYPPAVVERLSANSWAYSLALPGQEPGEPAYRGTTDIVQTGYSALGQVISLISQASSCVVVLGSSAATQPFNDGDRIYINECAGMAELNEGEFLVSGITYGSVTVTVIDAAGTSTTITATGWYFTLIDPLTMDAVDSSAYLQYQGGGFAVEVVALFAAPGDYPACGTLYQERLCVGGSDNNPTQINGSVEDDYPNFITDPNEDDYAIQFTLVSNKLDQILNMIGTPNALLIGTAGGVWIMAGSNGASLSQTNVIAAKQTTQGVGQLQPQLVNDSAIFVSRSARIVLFLVYNFTTNEWDTYDLTRLNRNITLGPSEAQSGIAQTAFQMEPYPIFWCVRNDGQLIGLVFNRQDQVAAWFRVNMLPEGGVIESVAVISGQNQEDQVVAVVNRAINGVTMRYVEYFMPQELFSQLSNAFFVNCGLQLQLLPSVSITGISNSNPAQVTAPGHGFSNGMQVQITGVQGMMQTINTPNGSYQVSYINQDKTQAYTIENVTADTFDLVGMDSTAWPPYISGGSVMQVTNQVTGMNYLLGQQVTAVGDEALILEPTLVTSDVITFPYYSNFITIGIPYGVELQPTNPVLSSQASTTRGMPQKLNRVTLSLYQSMGGQYGTDPAHMYDITYGPGAQMQPPAMSSLEVTRDIDADWDDQSTFFIRQNQPFPFTVRGLVLRMSYNPD